MVEFLKLHSVADAKKVFFENLPHSAIQKETIATREALGRYIVDAVIADEFLPPFTRSSVDGYAISAADSHGAGESLPAYFSLIGEVPMGQSSDLVVHKGEAALIHTGGMQPEGTDAVVMLEYTEKIGADGLEVHRAVSVNENVLLKGEDVKPGDVVIPAGKRIRPQEIGGLLALGWTKVEVAVQPKVAVLSSGNELIPPEETPHLGQVRDINSYSLAALVSECGARVTTYPIIPDELEQMRAQIHSAFRESDVVIITAGSSVSVRDMTATVIAELGKPGILVHGINIRPGKPTILAVCGGKPVVGLPGNPVSALVIAHLFIRPLLALMQGMKGDTVETNVRATLKVNIGSLSGREEYMPTRLIKSGERLIAEPIFFKSNYIFQLSGADGLIRIESDTNGIEAGTEVDVLLF
jgi:molybdopterin molybdotransferase